MTTNGWETGPWRRESGELLDALGWLTDEDLTLITGRRSRPATHDVAVRIPAGTRTKANPRVAAVPRERRQRTR